MSEVPSERSYRALLRVPSLGRVLVGMTIARVAGSMVYLGLVLFSLSRYGSPAVAGAVAFAMMFPGLVVSPVAGALLDRYGRIRLVILDYAVAGCLLGLIGVLALVDALPAWLLIAICGIASLTEPLSASGLRSLFPLIVPEPLWERANAADSNSMVLATLIAPPVAAALVQVSGGPAAILAMSVTYAVAAVVMVAVREPVTAVSTTGHLLADAHDGVTYVLRNPTLRSLAMSISLSNLALSAAEIALPVIVMVRFGASQIVVGAVWVALGAAGLVSALLAGRIDTTGLERRLVAWPLFLVGLITTLLLTDVGLWVVFLGAILIGLVMGPLDVAMMTARQRVTDPAWMGRAFAVSMALNALGAPFGALLGGWLVEGSTDAAIVFSVVVSVLAALVAATTMPQQRRLPRTVVEPAEL